MPNECNMNGFHSDAIALSMKSEYIWKQFACVWALPSVHICLNGLCVRMCVCVCVRWSAFPSLFVKTEIGNCQQNFNHNQQQYIPLHFKATEFPYHESITWNLIMLPLKQQYHRHFQLKCLETFICCVHAILICTDVRHETPGNSWNNETHTNEKQLRFQLNVN